jgi:hypothetical protein
MSEQERVTDWIHLRVFAILVLPILAASLLVGAAQRGVLRQKTEATRSVAKPQAERTVCGEVMAYGGPVNGKMTRFDYGVTDNLAAQRRPEKPSYVELLVTDPAPVIRRFYVRKDARFTLGGAKADAVEVLERRGEPFRSNGVRLRLDEHGEVTSAEAQAWLWTGQLRRVAPGNLYVYGGYGVQDPGSADWEKDFRSWLDPADYYRKYSASTGTKGRNYRIPLAHSTAFSVNRDPVTRLRLKAEVGRHVEIVPDCQGRARYVDVYKVNELLNFTGGNRPLYYDTDAAGRPVRLHRDRLGRWAFVLKPPARAGAPPQKLLWTAPDVKAYDRRGFLLPPDDPFDVEGLAGVWVDSKSGQVTHIFWGSSGE